MIRRPGLGTTAIVASALLGLALAAFTTVPATAGPRGAADQAVQKAESTPKKSRKKDQGQKAQEQPEETAAPDDASASDAAPADAGAEAGRQSAEPWKTDLWSDPTFQREFLGSYGTNSEIEPKVDDDEREQMREVVPLLEAGETERAAEALQRIVTPESSAALDFTLANLYFQLERFDEAKRYYESAVAKFPNFRRALKNLAMIHVREGRLADAAKPLGRVIQLGGGDGLTFGFLGFSYNATEQYVSAESAFRSALLMQPEMLDWKLGLTEAVLKQQKYNEAVALCEELIARDPRQARFWLLQANAYIGLGQPLEAAQNYEMLDRMGQATVTSQLALGDIYVNEEMWDLAARAYGKAVTKDPEQPVEALLRRAEFLAQRAALPQASGLLTAIESLYADRLSDAERKKLLKLEARIAVADGSGGVEAAAALEEIVALDPLDGEALMLLARYHASEDDKERALLYYERAGSLPEFEAEAKIHQAEILVAQARYGEALPLLKRAQEIEPRDDVGRYLEQVERAARSRQ